MPSKKHDLLDQEKFSQKLAPAHRNQKIADWLGYGLITLGLAMFIPVMVLLIIEVAALIVPSAAAFILALGLSEMIATYGLFLAGIAVAHLGGFIGYRFGTFSHTHEMKESAGKVERACSEVHEDMSADDKKLPSTQRTTENRGNSMPTVTTADNPHMFFAEVHNSHTKDMSDHLSSDRTNSDQKLH